MRLQFTGSALAVAAAFALAAPALAQPAAPDPALAQPAIVKLPAQGGAKLTVTIPAWKDGGDIPFANTQYRGNTFPGLSWTKGPKGTTSYAIIMQDTDLVIRGGPVLHWTMFNLPASVTKLEAGMVPTGNPAGSAYGPNYKARRSPTSARAPRRGRSTTTTCRSSPWT